MSNRELLEKDFAKVFGTFLKFSGKDVRVAIDGPGGVGKSTLASGFAEQLGGVSLSAGNYFRTLAYLLLQDANMDPVGLIKELSVMQINKKIVVRLSGKASIFSQDQLRSLSIATKLAEISSDKTIAHHVDQALLGTYEASRIATIEGRDRRILFGKKSTVTAFLDGSIDLLFARELKRATLLKGKPLTPVEEQSLLEGIEKRNTADRERQVGTLLSRQAATESKSYTHIIDAGPSPQQMELILFALCLYKIFPNQSSMYLQILKMLELDTFVTRLDA